MNTSWRSAPSVALISLPYLSNHWHSVVASPFFNVGAVFALFLILGLLEGMGRYVYSKSLLQGRRILIFAVIIVILFFYAYALVLYLQGIGLAWRSRILLGLIASGFGTVLLLFLWRRPDFKKVNIFFLIFGLVSLTSNVRASATQNDEILAPKHVNTPVQCHPSSVKPVLLLITDEYGSPDEWFKVYGDSSVYDYSNKLKAQQWQVVNSMRSHETSTFHSLSSLFNFNLSAQPGFSHHSIPFLGANKLIMSALSDSLQARGVEITNYGIVALGNTSALTRLYFYPSNFWEQLLFGTGVFHLFYNTNGFNLSGFGANYYLSDEHNKRIINTLSDTVAHHGNSFRFIYAHLYMPHRPLVYEGEFELREHNTLEDQFAFWQFANGKLIRLLSELTKENDLRIIVVGDHGYRGNPAIDPNNTFAAFYGFDADCVRQTISVQDLGSLILASFKQDTSEKESQIRH